MTTQIRGIDSGWCASREEGGRGEGGGWRGEGMVATKRGGGRVTASPKSVIRHQYSRVAGLLC